MSRFTKSCAALVLCLILTFSLCASALAAVKITSQPKDKTGEYGETVKTAVKAEGSGLKYTWYIKNAGSEKWSKSSITSRAYSVKMTEKSDGRQVYCVVKDSSGSKKKSEIATLTLERKDLELTAQPQDVSVAPDAKATVSVSATGDGLTYTWYSKDGDADFVKSKVTKSSYSVTMTEARDGKQVYCVITDAYGNSVTSNTVTMKMVKTYAAITTQPQDVHAKPEKTAKVSIEAIGDGLTYTWYTKDAGQTEWAKSKITKSSYSVTMNDARHERQVKCVIKDRYGNEIESEVATMYQDKVVAAFVKQPEAVTVAEGEKATISVEAVGDGLTYTWYTKDLGASKYVKSSVTKSSYSVTMNEARHKRLVYCVIKDAYGNKVTSAKVRMRMIVPEIEIVTQPQNVLVAPGAKATISVEATGKDLTYTWYTKDAGATEFVKSSVTKSSYSVTMNASRHGREVYCVIKDKYGEKLQTETAKMEMVITPLEITAQPQSVVVAEGEEAKVTVEANGDGLTYKWYFAAAGSSDFTYTKSFTGNSYFVEMTEARSGRQVYCVITDDYGESVTTETATLSMKGALAITKDLTAETYIEEGAVISLNIEATGDELTYQWYTKLPGAAEFTASSTTDTYTLNAAGTEMAGLQAYCVVTDAYGATVTSKTTTIKYKAPLAITTQPLSVAVLDGEVAIVTFEATGDGLTYEWYFAAPGSTTFKKTDSFTSNEYSVAMNEDRDGRQVYCVVTDMYGASVQTETVTLSLKPPVEYTIVDGKVTITAYIGSETTLAIPSVLEGATVTAIADNAFKSNIKLTSVTLPKTVTSIGASAFEGCSALKTITLSDNVSTIGRAAFKNCTSLETMKISN